MKTTTNFDDKNQRESSILNDGLWYYFNVTNLNEKQLEAHGKEKAIKGLNAYRKEYFKFISAPNVETATINNRNILKEYYDKKEPVLWIATAGDVSLPKGRQAGNLLLYHLAIPQIDAKNHLVKIMCNPAIKEDKAIDHHAWLRVSNIKYFGDDAYLDIAYGDVLIGQSFIKKYTDRNGNDSFTLGETIIKNCGMIKGNTVDMTCEINDPRWMAMSQADVVNYDHLGTQMLRLIYTKKAKQKIAKAGSKDINTLAKAKYYLTTEYKKYNTFNYHEIFDKNKLMPIREDMKNELTSKNTYESTNNSYISLNITNMEVKK